MIRIFSSSLGGAELSLESIFAGFALDLAFIPGVLFALLDLAVLVVKIVEFRNDDRLAGGKSLANKAGFAAVNGLITVALEHSTFYFVLVSWVIFSTFDLASLLVGEHSLLFDHFRLVLLGITILEIIFEVRRLVGFVDFPVAVLFVLPNKGSVFLNGKEFVIVRDFSFFKIDADIAFNGVTCKREVNWECFPNQIAERDLCVATERKGLVENLVFPHRLLTFASLFIIIILLVIILLLVIIILLVFLFSSIIFLLTLFIIILVIVFFLTTSNLMERLSRIC